MGEGTLIEGVQTWERRFPPHYSSFGIEPSSSTCGSRYFCNLDWESAPRHRKSERRGDYRNASDIFLTLVGMPHWKRGNLQELGQNTGPFEAHHSLWEIKENLIWLWLRVNNASEERDPFLSCLRGLPRCDLFRRTYQKFSIIHTFTFVEKNDIAKCFPSGEDNAQIIWSPPGSHNTLTLPCKSTCRRTAPG